MKKAKKIRLQGHVPHHAISKAKKLGPLAAGTEMHLAFILTPHNLKGLEDLAAKVSDPAQAEYGEYLPTAEFIKGFAPSKKDYKAVKAYAKGCGFTITEEHANRTLLHVRAKKEDAEKAFNVRFSQYKRTDGSNFYAADRNPEIDAGIAAFIEGVAGFGSSVRRRSYHRVKEGRNSAPFVPQDILKAYNLTGVPQKGSGQSIALFEMATYAESDIAGYVRKFQLPSPKIKNVLVQGGQGERSTKRSPWIYSWPLR